MKDDTQSAGGRRCANPTTCPVCKEIVRQFEAHPRTLSEVAARMEKAVSTVSFHVSGLAGIGVIKRVDGKYTLTTAEQVDNLVLDTISQGPKTLDEVVSDKRLSVFPVEQVHQSIDRHLLRRRLVSWPRFASQPGSTRFESEYKLSYLGAEDLHVCLHCGKPLGDGPVVQFHVKEAISERYGAKNLGREEYHHGVLFHSQCFVKERGADYLEQEVLRGDELCGLCGLPIDPTALEEEFSIPKIIGIRSLIPHLTNDELMGLVAYTIHSKVRQNPTPDEVDFAARELIRKEKLGVRGLADCERLLHVVNEGLRRTRRRSYQQIRVPERAEALWRIALGMIRSDETRVRRLVNAICSPQNVLLGRTTLYLHIFPFLQKGEFSEEEAYYISGRKQFGMVKGSIEDSGCGVAFKRGESLYHPSCYALVSTTGDVQRPAIASSHPA